MWFVHRVSGIMALWRLAGGRVSRFSAVARQMRYRSTVAVDDEKPEPPNGFLFNEKVWCAKWNGWDIYIYI